MKFLVTGKTGPTPMPLEHAAAIIQAGKEWINGRLADGRIDCHYVFPEGDGFSITNADSNEAVLDGLLEYPLYPFMTWEVRPLCDWSHSYDKYTELWQKIAAMS